MIRLISRGPLGLVAAVQVLQLAAGTALTPLLYELNILEPGDEGASYIARNGLPGVGASFAVFTFWVAVVLADGGFGGDRPMVRGQGSKLTVASLQHLAWSLLVVSLVAYAVLFALVDWSLLLTEARSGDIDAYGTNQRWLFLKSIASVGLYAACFGAVFAKATPLVRYGFAAVFGLYVLLTFVTSISRNFLLYALLIPTVGLTGRFGRRDVRSSFGILVALMLGALVLVYGKTYGQSQRALVMTGRWVDPEAFQSANPLIAFVRNTEFLWFSVDAALRSETEHGWVVVKEWALASALGFVPSRALASVGFGPLSYTTLADVGGCALNTDAYGLPGTTVPLGIIGFGAYTLSFVGPTLFGVILGATLALLSKRVNDGDEVAFVCRWVGLYLAREYLSFIPMAGALATFAALLMLLLLGIGHLMRARGRGGHSLWSGPRELVH